MTQSLQGILDKKKWMSNVLDIDRLKLTDLVWPCTHNSGMDKKAPTMMS